MSLVIGITGRAGHGKDTLAKHIAERVGNTETQHFATRLKEGCLNVFPFLEEADVYTQEGKLRALSMPVVLDMYIGCLEEEFGLSLNSQKLHAYTPREILQYVGTDYVRSVSPTYWVDAVSPGENFEVLLVPDVRFENEADRIHELGGVVVKVIREAAAACGEGHVSEKGVEDYDLVLRVPEGDFTPYEEFAESVALRVVMGA